MIADEFDPLKGKVFQIINEHGKVVHERFLPKFKKTELLMLYNTMVLARLADEKGMNLQRAGRMGTFAPVKGQEAAQIGSAYAAQKEDWIVPAFRESAMNLARGLTPETWYITHMGNEMGNAIPEGVNNLPMSICVASHIPHATGLAWAAKIKKDKVAVLAYFGDGATSEGAFHEGLNFAGVFQVPCVFICQNNQYAISLHVAHQTHAKTLAQKGIAYGIPCVKVDGNDVLAMYAVTKEALARARAGKGPTLIEAYTYRLEVHTTADDPTLYRSDKEVKQWEKKDPLLRFKLYLKKKGIWSKTVEQKAVKNATTIIDKAVKNAEAFPKPKLKDMFQYMYAEMTPQLEEQLTQAQAFKAFIASRKK